MLAFVPALVWIGHDTSVARAAGVGALVAVPQLLIDDGDLLRGWLRSVKHSPDHALGLRIGVDESLHVVCLLGAALIAAS
jgi:hypothetical protein